MYLLGYIPKDDRLYLGDKELNVISYSLLLSVLEYQTAVMRKDFSTADKVLPTIPKEQQTRVARFLEKQVCLHASFYPWKSIFVLLLLLWLSKNSGLGQMHNLQNMRQPDGVIPLGRISVCFL